jgi:hypothetical protein
VLNLPDVQIQHKNMHTLLALDDSGRADVATSARAKNRQSPRPRLGSYNHIKNYLILSHNKNCRIDTNSGAILGCDCEIQIKSLWSVNLMISLNQNASIQAIAVFYLHSIELTQSETDY